MPRMQLLVKTITLENRNKFKALQEEDEEVEKEESDEDNMEILKETKEKNPVQANL